ncbi:hypothetical protein O1L60_35965 [Streptomyces diastatochromogenes]|nr:hypothetical protein [Streptomyces diastatochromogenes]
MVPSARCSPWPSRSPCRAPALSARPPRPRGTLLLVAALVALLAGIIEGPAHGWTSPRILLLFAVGAALTGLFTWYALRSPAALFDPRVFRSRRLRAAVLGTATGFFGLFSLFYANSQYLQYVRGTAPPSPASPSSRSRSAWPSSPRSPPAGRPPRDRAPPSSPASS